MRYLLLIYNDPAAYAAMSEEEGKHLADDYWAFTEEIRQSGEHQAGEALQGLDTATTVVVKDGETLTTDGPFAETKEVLGGFYMVDVADLDRAIELAAKIPDARADRGKIEVRPIMEFTPEDESGAS